MVAQLPWRACQSSRTPHLSGEEVQWTLEYVFLCCQAAIHSTCASGPISQCRGRGVEVVGLQSADGRGRAQKGGRRVDKLTSSRVDTPAAIHLVPIVKEQPGQPRLLDWEGRVFQLHKHVALRLGPVDRQYSTLAQ